MINKHTFAYPNHNGCQVLSLFLGTFFILFAIAPLSQALTLKQAIEQAKQNNEKIKQYNEKLEQKTADDHAAWGNFLPSVELEGNYYHLNGPLSIDLDGIRDVIMNLQASNQTEFANIGQILQGYPELTDEQRAYYYSQFYSGLDSLIPHFEETFKDQDYQTLTITATQPIFFGGKIMAAKKYAAAEKRAAAAELVKTQNEIIRETVGDYLGVVLMNQLVNLRFNVKEAMDKHHEQAQKLINEGLIAKYHLLRAEVAVADAERNLFDDLNRRELAALVLAHDMAVDSLDPITLTDSLTYKQVPYDLPYYQSLAMENQQILRMIREKRVAANQNYNVERSEFMPHLAAFGQYEVFTEDLSSLEPEWVVGLNFQLTLFNGGQRYHKLQSAKHLQKEVDYIQASAERQVKLWVDKSYREMRNAEERYLKTSANIALAEENLRQAEKRFEVGIGTSIEIVDAELELEKNKIESLQSLYAYYTSYAELTLATGTPEMMIKFWTEAEN